MIWDNIVWSLGQLTDTVFKIYVMIAISKWIRWRTEK